MHILTRAIVVCMLLIQLTKANANISENANVDIAIATRINAIKAKGLYHLLKYDSSCTQNGFLQKWKNKSLLHNDEFIDLSCKLVLKPYLTAKEKEKDGTVSNYPVKVICHSEDIISLPDPETLAEFGINLCVIIECRSKTPVMFDYDGALAESSLSTDMDNITGTPHFKMTVTLNPLAYQHSGIYSFSQEMLQIFIDKNFPPYLVYSGEQVYARKSSTGKSLFHCPTYKFDSKVSWDSKHMNGTKSTVPLLTRNIPGTQYYAVDKFSETDTIYCRLGSEFVEFISESKNRVNDSSYLELDNDSSIYLTCRRVVRSLATMGMTVIETKNRFEAKVKQKYINQFPSMNTGLETHRLECQTISNCNMQRFPDSGILRCFTSDGHLVTREYLTGFSRRAWTDSFTGKEKNTTNNIIVLDSHLMTEGQVFHKWASELTALPIVLEIKKVSLQFGFEYSFRCSVINYFGLQLVQWLIHFVNGSQTELKQDSVLSPEFFEYSTNEISTRFGSHFTMYFVKVHVVEEFLKITCKIDTWESQLGLHDSLAITVIKTKSSTGEEANNGPLIGGTLGGIFLTMILTVALLTFLYKRSKIKETFLNDEDIEEFKNGNKNGDPSYEMESLPFNSNYELDPKDFTIDTHKLLGEGAYAYVYAGTVHDQQVAVKTVKICADKGYLLAILSELKIMSNLEKHESIVNLVGAFIGRLDRGTVYVFLEYCPWGNLNNFLRVNKVRFGKADPIFKTVTIDETGGGRGKTNEYIRMAGSYEVFQMEHLVKWSKSIAAGMLYLSKKKIMHGDLACRNVLIQSINTVKISDFGLSRKLYDYTVYVKKQQQPLPWRWMALESLQTMEFSVKSDVWAYGVTLWEIMSLGQVPYPGINWSVDFNKLLANGMRMSKPEHATDKIFQLISACWNADSAQRPLFEDICTFWEKENNYSSVYIDLSE